MAAGSARQFYIRSWKVLDRNDMRLAILADIHGNIPALEAALREIEKLAVDGFVVAGDMVVGPNSVEVLNRLRALDAWMIRGNNENYLVRFASGEAPDWWHTARQWSFMRWNYHQMNEEALNFIKSLPEQLTLRFEGMDPIRVVHGSPGSGSELIYPEKDRVALETALGMVSEPVLILGHTHQCWQMQLNGRLALNPGSVCSTFADKTGGSFALLSWENDRWEAELRDLHYDITLVRKAFEDTGLLEEVGTFAERWLYDIENGTNHIQAFVDYAYRKAAEAGYSDSPFVPDDIWDEADESFEIELAKG
jgi:putative phosphoesterase